MNYYCLSCKTTAESKLKVNLDNYFLKTCPSNFFRSCFPLKNGKIKKQGQYLTSKTALMPGHIFIETDIELQEYNREITKLFTNAFGLLRYKKDDYKLKNDDIKFALQMFSYGKVIEPTKVIRFTNLEAGQKIRVVSGPLEKVTGRIISVYKNTKVKVEVEFMGSKTTVQFPIDVVETIED